MKNPVKKKREWLDKIRAEGLTKKKEVEVEEDPNVPTLVPEAAWLWRAFTLLSVQRGYTQSGPQPISIRDIEAFSSLERLDGPDSVWLLDVIVHMDQVFLEFSYDKIKREHSQQAKKAKAKR